MKLSTDQTEDGLASLSPNDENVAYDDGIFTYDQYGNVIGRVRKMSARRRWHWAFTKIVQVGLKWIFFFSFINKVFKVARQKNIWCEMLD